MPTTVPSRLCCRHFPVAPVHAGTTDFEKAMARSIAWLGEAGLAREVLRAANSCLHPYDRGHVSGRQAEIAYVGPADKNDRERDAFERDGCGRHVSFNDKIWSSGRGPRTQSTRLMEADMSNEYLKDPQLKTAAPGNPNWFHRNQKKSVSYPRVRMPERIIAAGDRG